MKTMNRVASQTKCGPARYRLLHFKIIQTPLLEGQTCSNVSREGTQLAPAAIKMDEATLGFAQPWFHAGLLFIRLFHTYICDNQIQPDPVIAMFEIATASHCQAQADVMAFSSLLA